MVTFSITSSRLFYLVRGGMVPRHLGKNLQDLQVFANSRERLGHNETYRRRRRRRRRVLLQLDEAFDGDVDEFVLQRGLHEARSLLTKVQYRLEYVDLGIHTCPSARNTPNIYDTGLLMYASHGRVTIYPLSAPFLLLPSPPFVPILNFPNSAIHLPPLIFHPMACLSLSVPLPS